MKVFMTHKDKKFSAYFTSTVSQNQDDYGNGIYLNIRRNGFEFKYVDCRYMKDFDEEKVLREVLKNHYGENMIKVEVVEQ